MHLLNSGNIGCMNNPSELLAQYFSCDPSKLRVRRCHGGDIHAAFSVDTPKGRYFLKKNHPQYYSLFVREACELQRMAQVKGCRVPQVAEVFQMPTWSGLLLEYIELVQHGDVVQAAQSLAELHEIHPDTGLFGDEADGFIGTLKQSNRETRSWSIFWINERLRPIWESISGAVEYQDLFSAVCRNIEQKLIHAIRPSLVHGDLWSGNKAFDQRGRFVLYDPSSYFGDPEVDLAMAALFGGFPTYFFETYQKYMPESEGWEHRRKIYQLYYLLCHWKLFGGGYQNQSLQVMRSIVDS